MCPQLPLSQPCMHMISEPTKFVSGVKRMVTDIKNKQVNVVIANDLSCFGLGDIMSHTENNLIVIVGRLFP